MVRIVQNKNGSWTVYIPAKDVSTFNLILQEGEVGMLEGYTEDEVASYIALRTTPHLCNSMKNWEGFEYEKR